MVPVPGVVVFPFRFKIADMIGFAGDGGGKGHLNILLGVLAGDGVGGTPAGYAVCHGLPGMVRSIEGQSAPPGPLAADCFSSEDHYDVVLRCSD
ncbi:hypothetical protein L1987_77128 [Smallanthus sonchifolius]|uniref:Uncharacterized protein n=1 Tax=Smallanthus sonchifolius TaxID=185202 RepID=A0ACB8Z9B2_9ASTR|nr:hypothetical protein L1987_77128 [Smallanthus sonchifolius]